MKDFFKGLSEKVAVAFVISLTILMIGLLFYLIIKTAISIIYVSLIIFIIIFVAIMILQFFE